MIRYFLELSYLGTSFAGFQVQENAHTIQGELERAFQIFFREPVALTGSSRTDAGVHALQNFFHFDWPREIAPQCVYNLNALLPGDIAIRRLFPVPDGSHCRFDARSREYEYHIYTRKDPFASGRAYYFPYTLREGLMQEAAGLVLSHTDFAAFSKRGTQVKTTQCRIQESSWQFDGDRAVYRVVANRFLRGMVRGLTGTMLQVGRGKLSTADFQDIINSKDASRADFSVPGSGLYLVRVRFGEVIEAAAAATERLLRG